MNASGPLDDRLDDWVDDRLDPADRAAFQAELDRDARLREELHGYLRAVALVRRTPQVEAPPDLLRGVQARIRRRTRGRWYAHIIVGVRFPWEAAFNIVLLGVLIATYLAAVPPPDPQPNPRDVAAFSLGGGAFDTCASVLGTYGALEIVPGSLSDRGVAYQVTMLRSRMADLEDELALYPELTPQSVRLPDVDPARIQVRVFARRER